MQASKLVGDTRPRRREREKWQGDDGTGSHIQNPRVISPVALIKQPAHHGDPYPMPGTLRTKPESKHAAVSDDDGRLGSRRNFDEE